MEGKALDIIVIVVSATAGTLFNLVSGVSHSGRGYGRGIQSAPGSTGL